MKRAMIFWDYSNFSAGLRQMDPGAGSQILKNFGMEAFCSRLAENQDLIRVYFVGSAAPESDGVHRFFNAVDRTPRFYVKEFMRRGHGEKQVDVYLATQMVALAYENAYDVAYLISGDEDFAPAIELVQAKGKNVVAVSFKRSLSDELDRKADMVLQLDEGEASENPFHYSRFIS